MKLKHISLPELKTEKSKKLKSKFIMNIECPKCKQSLLVKKTKLYCINKECLDYTKVKDV